MISVDLLDFMGDDLAIVNAARVSMNKSAYWRYRGDGTPYLDEKDAKLIYYLAKHRHFTPFCQNSVKLRFKMPIFVARQWYKHKVGLIENEVSRRYITTEPEFYIPDYFREKAENVKQGSVDFPAGNSEYWKEEFNRAYKHCVDVYNRALADNICPEQARMVLPQAMMTEFIQTGNLYSFYHIWELRTGEHAQKEIRDFAYLVEQRVSELFPVGWAALKKFKKGNVK